MLTFLSPRRLSDARGLQYGIDYIRYVIQISHEDPFMKLLDPKEDLYHQLQILHLVARKPFRALLEYVMAAFAAQFVSNPEHLLAIDTRRDYRGDTLTPREFNSDAYEMRCLFHKRRVHTSLFVPFVIQKGKIMSEAELTKIRGMRKGVRRYAYDLIKRHHLRRAITQRAVATSPSKPKKSTAENDRRHMEVLRSHTQHSFQEVLDAAASLECLAGDATTVLHLLQKLPQKHFLRFKATILRAVGVTQSWRVLLAAMNKYTGDDVLHAFLIGEDMGNGRNPVDELRALYMWG